MMTNTKELSKNATVTSKLFSLILDMSKDEQGKLYDELKERVSQGKREHQRKPFFTVVNYATQSSVYKDFIKNISAGGVFIETSMPFSGGQEVSLTFPLPNQKEHIKIIGKVVRISDQGIGVKFRTVNQDQEKLINALIAMI